MQWQHRRKSDDVKVENVWFENYFPKVIKSKNHFVMFDVASGFVAGSKRMREELIEGLSPRRRRLSLPVTNNANTCRLV